MNYYNRAIVPFFFCMFSVLKAADHLILVSSEGKEIGISRDVVAVSSVLQKCKPQEVVDFSEQQLMLLCQLSIFERDHLQKEGVTRQSIDLFGQLFPSDGQDHHVHCFEVADFFNLSIMRKLLVEKVAFELREQGLQNGWGRIEMTYSPKFIALLERKLKEKERGLKKNIF